MCALGAQGWFRANEVSSHVRLEVHQQYDQSHQVLKGLWNLLLYFWFKGLSTRHLSGLYGVPLTDAMPDVPEEARHLAMRIPPFATPEALNHRVERRLGVEAARASSSRHSDTEPLPRMGGTTAHFPSAAAPAKCRGCRQCECDACIPQAHQKFNR